MNTTDAEPIPFRALSGRTSLAQQVCTTLRSEIVGRLRPGDKLPNLRELGRQLGVSINTVLAAVDLLSRDGLVEKRHGRGIYVAERARRWRVGVLSELDLLDSRVGPSFRTTANLLRLQLSDRGAEVQLYVGHAEPGLGASDEPTCPQFWDDAAAGRLDGAIILDVPSTPAWHRRVRACRIPAVGSLTGYEVHPDQAGMAAVAVQHLAGQGCRRLGLISWHGEAFFRQAVAEAEASTSEAWIRADLDPAMPGTGWEEFREIWSSQAGRPDGLVVLDDMLFVDAQLAMLELGVRIPQDLRLVAMNVHGASRPPRLPVARLDLDPAKVATVFVDLLLAQLRGEPVSPRRHPAPFQLIPPPDDGGGSP